MGGWHSPHSDGAPFSDGVRYVTPVIVVAAAVNIAIGDTSMTLQLLAGISDLSGVRFSY